jgi:hypothetical protein
MAKITYLDLGLEELIKYYESKKDRRSKVTASYLREHLAMMKVRHAAGRERLMELMPDSPAAKDIIKFAKEIRRKR